MTAQGWFLLYLLMINIAAFILFGIDKWKSIHGCFRISEKALFAAAWIGGSFGARLGMLVFHHKTRHRKFTIGIPLIFLLQVVAVMGWAICSGMQATP